MKTSFLVVITYDVETFQLMINEGISELLFTSDNVWQMEASYYPELPGALKTANFQSDEISNLNRLKKLQVDYDAPLSEAGDITEKFQALKEVIEKYNPDVDKEVSFNENHKRTTYGKDIDNINMKLLMQQVRREQGCTWSQVFLDFQLIHTTDSVEQDKSYIDEKELSKVTIKLQNDQIHNEKGSKIQLDILVENMGRVNFWTFMNKQRKGILGDVLVDGEKQRGWKIYPMDFKGDFFKRISRESDWTKMKEGELPSIPSLYRGTFEVTEEPKDTFLHMKGWTKGVCFINGHNLGRYWQIGPQETLYLPAPWLNKGHNELLVFELEKCEVPDVSFVTEPKLTGEPVFRQ
ncbi:beta-galactosidase-1-like protein 2 [Orbicella faveolata]|uniref:beta-galactosidase-1-like protein 2 n=1 Tax=Orbicella faveolata TaxID=48498 RepID=UPI0009E4B6B6|nr:beta-galactosidase-1-like protein 2 [Orbicella faveolata]